MVLTVSLKLLGEHQALHLPSHRAHLLALEVFQAWLVSATGSVLWRGWVASTQRGSKPTAIAPTGAKRNS